MGRQTRMGKGPSYAAIDRFIVQYQPCTVMDMYENATMRNGKYLKNTNFALSMQRIGQYMTRSGKFEIKDKVRERTHLNYETKTRWQFKEGNASTGDAPNEPGYKPSKFAEGEFE